MDPSIAPTSRAVKGRKSKLIASLEVRVSELESNETSLLRIASQAVRALKSQECPIQPRGIWMSEGDEDMMERVDELVHEREMGGDGQPWKWRKIRRTNWPPTLPNFSSVGQVQRYKRYFKLEPFRHPFPLEIFELIISFAGQAAISRTSQASLACFQLFSPVLYHSVKVPDFVTLRWLFRPRTTSVPPRLASNLSLNNIRVLELTLSSFSNFDGFPGADFSLEDRLDDRIQLDKLIIVMDLEPSPSETIPEEPSLTSFDLGALLLERLNPTELLVRLDYQRVKTSQPSYRIAITAPFVISRHWSRLRTARFKDVDLIIGDPNVNVASQGLSFWWLDGRARTALTDLSLVWDLAGYDITPSYGWDNMIDLLVKRDRTLFQPFITSATILVDAHYMADELREIMAKYHMKLPSCLKVVSTEEPEEGGTSSVGSP